MSIATIERPRRQDHGSAQPLADLQAAHLAAAGLVAQLDLDDRQRWARVDRTVAEVAASAYRLAAAMTGEPAGTVAASLPPVVRVRELAAAHRRLFRALDRHPAPPAELVWHATEEVRRIGQQLQYAVSAG